MTNCEIKVNVRLYSGLQPKGIESGQYIQVMLPEGAAIRDLMEKLLLPLNLTMIFLVNHVQKQIDVELIEGDTIDILPPLAGG